MACLLPALLLLACGLCRGDVNSVHQHSDYNATTLHVGEIVISGPPEGYHSHYSFARENATHPRTEIEGKLFSRIKTDLEPWRNGITREMVEHTYCTDYERNFRFQIIKGEMFVVGEIPGFYEFNRMTKLFILDVASKYNLPDIDVVITSADNCPDFKVPLFGNNSRCPSPAPLLSNSRLPWQTHCALFPAFSFGSGGWPMPHIPSWQSYLDLMSLSRPHMLSWAQKTPKMFFRGAPTGQRKELLQDITLAGSRIDAILQANTEFRRQEEHVSLPAHCDYRYLLNLPGIGYSARLKYLLLCESSVVMYDNQMDEFWYHLLEDKKHLLKVVQKEPDRDAPALLEALNFLEEEPEQAELMAKAGARLIEEALTTETVQRYFAELLTQYAALQTFKPKLHQNAVPFRLSVLGPDAEFNPWKRSCSHCTFDPATHVRASG